MKSQFRYLSAGLMSAIWAGALCAQTTPTAPDTSAPTNDEVVVLSPFVVKSTEGSEITESTSGTLVSRPLEKTPMAISVFSAELMKDMMVLNGDHLTRIVPGLAAQNNQTSEGAGGNQQYASRGFTVLPRRNGFAPGGRLYDMTGVDRVEIIRGPNSILYGQNDPGGVINYISKRPRLRNETGVHGQVTAVVGNYSFYRGATDIDLTLLPGKLGFRLPMSYTYNERDSKWFSNQVVSINPSVLWRILPNTEIMAEFEYLDIETGFGALQPIVWVRPGEAPKETVDKSKRGLGRETNYTFGPYSNANNKMTNTTIDLTSRLNEHITFRAVYSQNGRDRDQVVPAGGDPFRTVPTPWFGAEQQDGNQISGYKADLLGEYEIGPFTSRTVLGYEYNTNDYYFKEWRTYQNGATLNLFTLNVGFDPLTGLATRDTVASDYVNFPRNNYVTNSIDPTNTLGGTTYEIPTVVDPNNPWRLFRGPQRFTSTWTNIRISEVLSAYDDRVQMLLGYARGQSENLNQQSKVKQELPSTPIYQAGIGVMVDKARKHMLFVNYSTSYAPQFLLDINNQFLPPQEASGLEGGFKSVWNNALRTTLTIFTQERTNVGRQYNDQTLSPPRTYGVLSPGEESKGFEFEALYRVSNRLELRAGWAQYDGKITGASATEQYKIGRELPRAPELSGTFSANYTVQGGRAAGLRIGYGFTYKNDTILDLNNGLNSLTRRSDEYLVQWMTLAKDFKLANRRAITLRLNVGNLLNENYVTEGFTFGELRTIRFSTDFKF